MGLQTLVVIELEAFSIRRLAGLLNDESKQQELELLSFM
jgi:hypothetical protein